MIKDNPSLPFLRHPRNPGMPPGGAEPQEGGTVVVGRGVQGGLGGEPGTPPGPPCKNLLVYRRGNMEAAPTWAVTPAEVRRLHRDLFELLRDRGYDANPEFFRVSVSFRLSSFLPPPQQTFVPSARKFGSPERRE